MELSSFVDIHVHILPAIDDGPKSIDESVAMAEIYHKNGVSRIFATPHYIPGTAWVFDGDFVKRKVELLNNQFAKEGLALQVIPGMEIAYHGNILERIKKKIVIPLGDTNIYLLEPSFDDSPVNLLASAKAIMKAGYGVIIVHPERVGSFKKTVDSLISLVKQGLQVQVTLGSLLGCFGSASKRLSISLIEAGAVHYLASDAHDSIKRPPPNYNDWQKVVDLLGEACAEKLCCVNPGLLLQGEADGMFLDDPKSSFMI